MLGCPALGMESGDITATDVTASSKTNNQYRATNARLNKQLEGGAWIASEHQYGNAWLQVSIY